MWIATIFEVLFVLVVGYFIFKKIWYFWHKAPVDAVLDEAEVNKEVAAQASDLNVDEFKKNRKTIEKIEKLK